MVLSLKNDKHGLNLESEAKKLLQVRFNKQIFYQIELKTRIAKLTMNEKGLILQEDWKEPVITVIHF